MYTYHFVAEIHGINLGAPLKLVDVTPLLRNLSIEQGKANDVVIRATKSRTWPEDIAKNEAAVEVDELVDRLSLLDNHRVITVKYVGYYDEDDNFHPPPKKGGLSGNLTAGLPNPLAYYTVDRQKRVLIGKLNPGLTRLHRIAQGMPNGIGKYLLLYGAL